MNKLLIILLPFLFVQSVKAQEVYSLATKWELRDKHNDPDISSDYREMRVNFAASAPIYFVFGGGSDNGYPSSIAIKRGRPFTDNMVMLNAQALINGAWKKYTLDFYINRWGEALIRDAGQVRSVYSDFAAATRLRMRLGYVGESWGEFAQSSFIKVASQLFTPPDVKEITVTAEPERKPTSEASQEALFKGLSREWPDRGLFLGLRKNAFVKQLKMGLSLSGAQLNGDYDADLKDAVAFYIKVNRVTDERSDGSVVSKPLYFKILNVDEDGNPLQSEQQSSTSTPTTENEKPQNASSPQPVKSPENLRVNGNIFPVFLNEPASPDSDYAAKVRYYIGQLQRCVNAKQTGRVNQETIDKVRSFLTNPKIKPLLVNPMDSESSELLNGNPPGITASLYNIIVHTRDRITIRNSEAKTPADVIN